MNELNDMTPEELEAILGTDYETVIADALRRKEKSEGSGSPDRAAGQMANGHVYFDPGYAIEKGMNRYRMGKEGKAAQGDLDKALAGQTAGRKTYANALLRGGPGAAQAGVSDINAGPPKPPAPPTAPPVAPPPPAPPAPPAPPMGAVPPQAGLGPMPSGEPLRGPPKPGSARPPLANASTMDPSALEAAGVPPEVLAELLRKRGMQ
jgi:hypothetical protein